MHVFEDYFTTNGNENKLTITDFYININIQYICD